SSHDDVCSFAGHYGTLGVRLAIEIQAHVCHPGMLAWLGS
ncbi:MAG: hypothetical protein JWN06_439, partial [Propionibacteriaceae bacterium]|nr:hypothetical protein [Propionibacteriaceae bacterium]